MQFSHFVSPEVGMELSLKMSSEYIRIDELESQRALPQQPAFL